MYREYIDEERARDDGTFKVLHRPFCSLQKLVFVGLDVDSIGDFHGERSSHTGDRNKLIACDEDPAV